MSGSIYDFTLKDHNQKDVAVAQFKGKKIVFVNVASKCGLAKQSYANMKAIIEKYHGSVVFLLFPAQHLLNQEFTDIKETMKFARGSLGEKAKENEDFVLFDYITIFGKNTHPLYKFLTGKLGGWVFSAIKWNFTAFLADENGNLLKRYSPTGFITADDSHLSNISK